MRTMAATLAAASVVAGCSVFGGTAAEEPPFTVVAEDGTFEIRSYATVTVARTVVDAPYGPAVREGFGRLFDYITGANLPAAEIEMTAPVIVAPTDGEGTEIAMTAPVLIDAAEGAQGGAPGWAVSFVLPEDMTLADAPRPADARVTLGEIPGGRVAVARFSGRLNEEKGAREAARLADWLSDQGEIPTGAWRLAGYNPPWTIPSMRRNEVLWPLTDPE